MGPDMDEFLKAIAAGIVFAVLLFIGCYAAGKTHDNWREHDEKVNKLRRERGVTNPLTPLYDR